MVTAAENIIAVFQPVEEASAGTVVAVTGLSRTYAGQGLGACPQGSAATLEPVLNYRLLLPPGAEAFTVLPQLRQA